MFDRDGMPAPRRDWARPAVPSWMISLLIVGIAAAAAFFVGRSADGNPALLLMLFVGAPALLVLISSRLEQAVIVFLVYAAFEGLLKNLAGGNPSVYLLRDVFLIAILGKLIFGERDLGVAVRRSRGEHSAAAVAIPIFLFILVLVVQILNPTLDDLRTNIVIGLGGIHQRILPIVLFFAALRFVESRDQVDKLQRLLIYLGVVVAVVLVLQVVMGQQRWASLGFSWYGQGAGDVFSPQAERAGVPRPSSVAQDAGAAAWFILTALFLSMGFLSRRRTSGQSVLWQATVAGFLLLALLLTFARTSYMSLMLGSGLFLLLMRERLGGRLPAIGASVLLVVFLVGSIVPDTYMDAIYYRAHMSILNPIGAYTSPQGGRVYLLMDIPRLIVEHPLGTGLGRTGPGQATFSGWFPGATFGMIENGFGALIYEAGVMGGVLALWIFLAMLLKGFGVTRRLRDEDLKTSSVAMLTCVFVTLAAMFSMNPLDASPFNGYLWLLSGVLLRLPKVEANETEASEQQGAEGFRSPPPFSRARW